MVMVAVGRIAEGIITSGPGRHRDGASDLLSKRTREHSMKRQRDKRDKSRGGGVRF